MNQQEFSELLPWYVNGTLSSNEQARVEAWLAQSSEARNELAVLQQLAHQIKSAAIPVASELGWQRL